MIENILENSKRNKTIISVFVNEDNTENYFVGYVTNYNNLMFIMAMIDCHGLYDGYQLFFISDVYRIEYDGMYENKIRDLYKLQFQEHHNINSTNQDLRLSILEFAKSRNNIVSLEFYKSELVDVEGYIDIIDNDELKINKVDEYGNKDGSAIININSITLIACDSLRQKTIDKLFKNNYINK